MTTTTAAPPPPGDRIIDEPLSEALSRRYLAYALSVITDRALPDVRDGLKPVQRRVLYAMREMRLNPEAAARKCAKVVGEVMGGYHPHGDQSIYDTLVRMAQDFASAIRWSTVRATSATSTAITPPPCATPRPSSPRRPRCCWTASTRTPSISSRPTTARTTS